MTKSHEAMRALVGRRGCPGSRGELACRMRRPRFPLCQTSWRLNRIGTLRWRTKTRVARYGQASKDRVVARLLPPESSSVEQVSCAVAISVATLERDPGELPPHWPPAARRDRRSHPASRHPTLPNTALARGTRALHRDYDDERTTVEARTGCDRVQSRPALPALWHCRSRINLSADAERRYTQNAQILGAVYRPSATRLISRRGLTKLSSRKSRRPAAIR